MYPSFRDYFYFNRSERRAAFLLLLIIATAGASAYFGYIFWTQHELHQTSNQSLEKQLEAQRLQDLDSFKTRLFTNLTHEFRAPLTVILGMAKQLIEQPQKDVQQNSQIIERNGKNLLQLVNQLLDLAKLEAGGVQLQASKQDIVRFLRRIFISFASMGERKQIKLLFRQFTRHLFKSIQSRLSYFFQLLYFHFCI